MMPTKFVAALATMLSFVTAQADTIKVNPDGSGDYTTIDAAIVAAEPGAVIEVAEGTYPGTVNITKSLTLKGAGRGKSIIDGAGVRRCVAIASGVNDVVLDGFTFVRGKNAASDGLAGGLYADGGTGIFVVDSTFENCVSHKGGAIASTTASGVAAVRCLFTGNESLNAYGTGSEALHQVDAYYCVFTRSYAQYVNGSGDAPVNGPCTLVNCTFANTGYYAYFIKGGVKAYNCIFARSAAKAGLGAGDYLYSCVCSGVGSVGGTSDGDTTAAGGDDYHFVNMLKDDYRLVETSSALGKGNCDYLAQIPETYRLKDFNGNTVDPTGTVNAGAVAVGSVKPAGARIQIFPWSQSTGDIVVDGVTNRFDNYFTGSDYTRYLYNSARIHLYFHSESWPTFHHVKLLGTDGSTVWGLAASGRDDTYRYPESDGEFVFMPPPYEEGHCLQLDAKAAGTVLYVDDDSTAAEPDGTIGNEFNKIQDAVDKVAKNAFAIIHVAAGTYDQGGSNYCPFSVPVIKSRVNVHDKSVRLIGAGAESTFIVGEPDPNAAADKYGLGTGATRCVTACSACSVEGFTLTGGHTSTTTSYCDSFGGALSAEGTSAAVLRVSDCVISNNWANYAPVADATYGKAKTILSRCRILDNVSVAGPAWAKEIVSQSSLWAFNRTLNKTTDRNVNVWSGSVACIFDSTWYAVADDFNFMGYIALMDADKTVFRNVVCQGSGAVRNHCADGCVIDTVIPVPDGAAAKTTYVTALTGEYKAGAGIARFVDPENGDFRVKSTSGAVGAAFYKYDPVNDQTLNSNAYIFATCSLDGVYPDFAANEGWFAAGAYRRPVPVAVTAGENIRP